MATTDREDTMAQLQQIIRSQMTEGRVLSNTALTSRLFSLCIEVELSPFEAGQFVRLQLPIDNEKVAKPYSLVSTPDEAVAEVFFNIEEGYSTHYNKLLILV